MLTSTSILNLHMCEKFEECKIKKFNYRKKVLLFLLGVYIIRTLPVVF